MRRDRLFAARRRRRRRDRSPAIAFHREPNRESLRLGNPLDFDRDDVDRVLDSLEPIFDGARRRRMATTLDTLLPDADDASDRDGNCSEERDGDDGREWISHDLNLGEEEWRQDGAFLGCAVQPPIPYANLPEKLRYGFPTNQIENESGIIGGRPPRPPRPPAGSGSGAVGAGPYSAAIKAM
jgi:hypothetical protein